MKTWFFLILFLPSFVYAKPVLLDKILAVINDQIITLSTIKRVHSNTNARKNISPQIFFKDSFTDDELVNMNIRKVIIRARLAELGYTVSDEQVDAQIKDTETRLNLTRNALLQFLNSNNMSYDEYFELIRETIEFNLFTSRVIRPLVSVTEQEVKNTFYKENLKGKTVDFKYTLVDFSLAKKEFKSGMRERFQKTLISYQIDGRIPEEFKNIESTVIDDLTEEGLTKDLKDLLKKTDEGSFTPPILMGEKEHVFFVKKKDLIESAIFIKEKDRIREDIAERLSKNMINLWYQREKSKHYIQYFP